MEDEIKTTYVLTLSDTTATLETVGGKGLSLARMADAHMPIPTGFHITTVAYRNFIAQNVLQPKILAALRAVLKAQGFKTLLQTAFVEQVNLTFRIGVAPLIRKTWA